MEREMGHEDVARPLNNKGGILQDAQKGQTSYLPNPGDYFTLPPRVCQDRLFALGRALSQARPQRAITF